MASSEAPLNGSHEIIPKGMSFSRRGARACQGQTGAKRNKMLVVRFLRNVACSLFGGWWRRLKEESSSSALSRQNACARFARPAHQGRAIAGGRESVTWRKSCGSPAVSMMRLRCCVVPGRGVEVGSSRDCQSVSFSLCSVVFTFRIMGGRGMVFQDNALGLSGTALPHPLRLTTTASDWLAELVRMTPAAW